jgi:hypothetical protein
MAVAWGIWVENQIINVARKERYNVEISEMAAPTLLCGSETWGKKEKICSQASSSENEIFNMCIFIYYIR